MDTIMIGGGGDFHDWYVAAIGTGTGILHHGGGTLCCCGGGRSCSGRCVTREMRARFNTGRMIQSELCVTLMFVTAE